MRPVIIRLARLEETRPGADITNALLDDILLVPMARELNLLVLGSMAGLLVILAIWARKQNRWRTFALGAVALAAFGLFLNRLLGFPNSPVLAKGREDFSFV